MNSAPEESAAACAAKPDPNEATFRRAFRTPFKLLSKDSGSLPSDEDAASSGGSSSNMLIRQIVREA